MKKRVRQIEVYITETTKTIEIMNQFEGLNGGEPYEQLVIKNAFTVSKGKHYDYISLVVERGRDHGECKGDITFTQFKQGYIRNLREFVREQITEADLTKYKDSKDFVRFKKPYLLRAQNKRNRTGYGWEWDWSGGYGSYIEGTEYGETTRYCFVGAYIGRR